MANEKNRINFGIIKCLNSVIKESKQPKRERKKKYPTKCFFFQLQFKACKIKITEMHSTAVQIKTHAHLFVNFF